jgi:hypothetical protein
MDDLVLRPGQEHGALRSLAVRHQPALGLRAPRRDRLFEDFDDAPAQIGTGLDIRQPLAQ